MRNKNYERDIAILMEDRCTKREAEKLLKSGTIVYENPGEWIQNLRDCDCYNGETLKNVRLNRYPNVNIVNYQDHEYLIDYVF